ncbi:YfiR family protein [Rhizorhapis suberifaciens]|uniref:YfiR family protein n=1 Tax=Rhizorhapis suberifaciens TaxID=13656 RepID=A0A840HS57_9SPHN|nr:YfiR family protein [Rhizorhapis suberifaciens]MBB4640815.1 hypothetical protein [Rhizorhapis suberifaciens]
MARYFFTRSVIGLALALTLPQQTVSAQSTQLETKVKAAFLPKFAAYVNWPPGALGAADDPIRLCIIGRNNFGQNLDEAAASERIGQHVVEVSRLKSVADAGGCHIAFLGGSATESATAMLDALKGQPILTVTDARFGNDRGIVHFVLKDGRVRFHIDDALAAANNLGISARLLSLAVSVRQRGRA